ncbi:MAG: hypothetical protein E7277_04710 [Lachnospiraceae bacterium]|jgi:hypothetical protein|nr:hypothetical protein [Lachnospiraceae bacterium]
MNKHIPMLKKCIAALAGIFLVGVGVAFNAMAHLGNDPVGIFYDGIRNFLGLTQVQLGIASNIVNLTIVVILLFIARQYVNIGTVIYLLPYGNFVDVGTKIYLHVFSQAVFWQRVVAVVIGCFLIFLGVAIYIAVNIGVDPMTGVALFIGDKLKLPYKKAKVIYDISITTIGFLLGGKLGVVTVISALIAGPIIQKLSEFVTRLASRMEKVVE